MNILVTGGAGYIGSHTCIALLEAGHKVVIADNFCNSTKENIENIKRITNKDLTFFEIDVTDADKVDSIFANHSIDSIIHFAGLKAVGESVEQPASYYFNNLVSTMILANACIKYGIKKFIFSSSATVYGENKVPFKESMNLFPTTNPYGETKVMSERILNDISKAHSDLSVTHLRYFNPVGAHESGLLGERPNGVPNNLMPYLAQVANGRLDHLRIFGGDYPTKDGTGIRDYIHVMDLAEGHLAALNSTMKGINIYNLGTGKGTSVLELIHEFERVNGVTIPYQIVDRRQGDITLCYADVGKAKKELQWETKRNLGEMCRDAWFFEQNNMDRLHLIGHKK